MTIDRLGRYLHHMPYTSKHRHLQTISKGDSVISFFGDGELSSESRLKMVNKGFQDYYRNRFYKGTIKHINMSPSTTLVVNGVRYIRSKAIGVKINVNDIIALEYLTPRQRAKEPYFVEIFLSNDDFT